MDPQQIPNKAPRKTSEMILGIVIGVFQIPLIFYVANMLVSTFSVYINSAAPFFIIILGPLVLEAFLLRKNHADMAKGILIGTVVLPFLLFGACLLMLSGGGL